MPRFAANLSFLFQEVAFPARFTAAAAAGFTAVEFLFPYDYPAAAIAGWLADARLEQVLFNLPAGDFDAGERGLAGLPGRDDDFRRGLDRALVYADVLGVPRLHCMAGLTGAGATRSLYERRLAVAAEALAAEGRTLLIEPINGRDMPGYLLDSHELALDVIRAVGAPNLRLQADLYHLQIIAGDVTTRLARDIASIGHVQIAGVPDRGEPDGGELNYPYVFDRLDRLGYAGWVGCEYRPRGATVAGLGWLAAARAASA